MQVPPFVAADTDISAACEHLVRSCFLNLGATPVSCQNIFVESGIYEEFCEQLGGAVDGIVLEDPLDRRAFLGPAPTPQVYANLVNQLRQIQEGGFQVLQDPLQAMQVREELSQAQFVRPGVYVSQNLDMPLLPQGIPVAGIFAVKDLSQALRQYRKQRFAAASVWSEDIDRAQSVAQQVRAKHVWINSWLKADLDEWGGGADVLGALSDDQARFALQWPRNVR